MERESDHDQSAATRPASECFDRELTLVEGALTLVASGGAPSVTLVGLNGGQGLLRLAVDLGARMGVAVKAWRHGAADRPEDPRFDLLFERNG